MITNWTALTRSWGTLSTFRPNVSVWEKKKEVYLSSDCTIIQKEHGTYNKNCLITLKGSAFFCGAYLLTNCVKVSLRQRCYHGHSSAGKHPEKGIFPNVAQCPRAPSKDSNGNRLAWCPSLYEISSALLGSVGCAGVAIWNSWFSWLLSRRVLPEGNKADLDQSGGTTLSKFRGTAFVASGSLPSCWYFLAETCLVRIALCGRSSFNSSIPAV